MYPNDANALAWMSRKKFGAGSAGFDAESPEAAPSRRGVASRARRRRGHESEEQAERCGSGS